MSCLSLQPPVSSCDVLVVPVGHTSVSRAINVMQKLWTAGVSADLVYDVSQVRVFIFDQIQYLIFEIQGGVKFTQLYWFRIDSFVHPILLFCYSTKAYYLVTKRTY